MMVAPAPPKKCHSIIGSAEITVPTFVPHLDQQSSHMVTNGTRAEDSSSGERMSVTVAEIQHDSRQSDSIAIVVR
jgi:hypothetical protein